MEKKQFTLIELLVIVAVIAILASMLLPAMNQVKKTAKSITCVNNQRQLGTAYAMYFSDWDGNFPYLKSGEAGSLWRIRLNTYLNAPNYPDSIYPATGGVFRCPSDVKEYAGGIPYAKLWGSYAHTSYLKIQDSGGTPGVTINQIKQPSAIIMLTEREINTYSYNFTAAPGSINSLYYRHSDRANFLFVDTHVKPQSFNELQAGLSNGSIKFSP